MLTPLTSTPASLGYYMPAEWQPHEATWLSWPHNTETWPGIFDRIPEVFAQMVKILSANETVNINVLGSDHEAEVRSILQKVNATMHAVQFHSIPTNDAWCRDHGPTFLKNKVSGEKAIINWNFNSWGSKYPYELDNEVPDEILKKFPMPHFVPGIVMEGGSIEVNGAGTVLTTRSCLLNKNRNPQLTQHQIEGYLQQYLGVQQVLWLEDGILGDDTDGHIDDLTRFVNENTVVTVVEDNPSDANFSVLQENTALLKTCRNSNGQPFEIVTLPMPAPVIFNGDRLPASYANFYIANTVVLVPVFGDKNDALALHILQNLFPDRTVHGIYCRDLVAGLGTLHCVTQQQPR